MKGRLGFSSIVLFLVILGFAAVPLGYGNWLSTRMSMVTSSEPLNYPSYTWIDGLSLWWTLAPSDHVQLSMQLDPRLNPLDVFFNISILQGIAPTTLQTVGLLQTWNITWSQWKNHADGIFMLNFTATHYYNIKLYMYIKSDTASISQPLLTSTVDWRDPSDADSAQFLLATGIALLAASPLPLLWRPLKTWLSGRRVGKNSF